MILPIADRHSAYAQEVTKELKNHGIRTELDERTESIGKKIREAEMQKTPYMLIVGDKEVESKTVALRKYGEGDKGQFETAKIITEITKS
jgi:threonyl-tRNA synthetase